MEHPDKITEQVDTTVEESGQLDSFTIQRTTLNYIIIAAVFFALGGGMTLITTQPFAQANQDENQQLIEQAVAAVLDARNEPTAVQQVAQAAGINRLDVDVDDDPTYGSDDAAVVIVEFSDFNCPYCGRFANETLPLLRDNYGDYVRFAYRDFPVLGDSSLQAAIAAECAGDDWLSGRASGDHRQSPSAGGRQPAAGGYPGPAGAADRPRLPLRQAGHRGGQHRGARGSAHAGLRRLYDPAAVRRLDHHRRHHRRAGQLRQPRRLRRSR